ncbi:MAG: hypothetical protein NT009_01600 [Proteobacteria bacterium]|nr:hypothetical protein [Pseudomonadota bacterium]
MPRRGGPALRVADLYGSETARDYVIAHIVRGAKPTPQKKKKASAKERFFARQRRPQNDRLKRRYLADTSCRLGQATVVTQYDLSPN